MTKSKQEWKFSMDFRIRCPECNAQEEEHCDTCGGKGYPTLQEILNLERQRVVEMIEGKLLLTPKSMDNGGRAEIKAWNCALEDLCSDLQSKLGEK